MRALLLPSLPTLALSVSVACGAVHAQGAEAASIIDSRTSLPAYMSIPGACAAELAAEIRRELGVGDSEPIPPDVVKKLEGVPGVVIAPYAEKAAPRPPEESWISRVSTGLKRIFLPWLTKDEAPRRFGCPEAAAPLR